MGLILVSRRTSLKWRNGVRSVFLRMAGYTFPYGVPYLDLGLDKKLRR